ncbi:MAG: DUF3365 domain-containing protein [Gemmataceae bacterium]|nr:DUF3365 domain-containing protein [Gemmataceae bacterium]MDW8267169.1 DUF3365 domain-containing protein [Gemmataceae bacterium]
MRLHRAVLWLVLGGGVLSAAAGTLAADGPAKPDPQAVERTREQVRMLDALYKSAVVSITKNYVNQQADVPAATVAKDVFQAMKAGRFHHARLIDVTGKPKNPDNVATTAFEKAAVEAIRSGKEYVEELAEVDGRPVLRAATPVPAVMPQCIVCHGKREKNLLGALIYEVPVK